MSKDNFGSPIRVDFDAKQAAASIREIIDGIDQVNSSLARMGAQTDSVSRQVAGAFSNMARAAIYARMGIETALNNINLSGLHSQLRLIQQQMRQALTPQLPSGHPSYQMKALPPGTPLSSPSQVMGNTTGRWVVTPNGTVFGQQGVPVGSRSGAGSWIVDSGGPPVYTGTNRPRAYTQRALPPGRIIPSGDFGRSIGDHVGDWVVNPRGGAYRYKGPLGIDTSGEDVSPAYIKAQRRQRRLESTPSEQLERSMEALRRHSLNLAEKGDIATFSVGNRAKKIQEELWRRDEMRPAGSFKALPPGWTAGSGSSRGGMAMVPYVDQFYSQFGNVSSPYTPPGWTRAAWTRYNGMGFGIGRGGNSGVSSPVNMPVPPGWTNAAWQNLGSGANLFGGSHNRGTGVSSPWAPAGWNQAAWTQNASSAIAANGIGGSFGGGSGSSGGGGRGGRTFSSHLGFFLEGTAIYMTVGRALYAFEAAVTHATKAMMDMESAQANIGFLMGTGGASSAKYASELSIGIGKMYGRMPTDVAQSMTQAVQTVKDPASQRMLVDAAAKLSVVAGVPVQEAQDRLIAIVKQSGLEFKDMGSILDDLAATAKRTNVPLKELMETFAEGGALKETFGLSPDRYLMLAGGVAETTNRSADAVRAMFAMAGQRLYQPSQSKKFWDATQVGMYKDAERQERRPVFDVLSELSTKWKDLDQSKRQQSMEAMFSTRYYFSGVAMMNNWDNLMSKMSEGMANKDGEFDRWMGNIADTFKFKVDKMGASWETLLLRMGNLSVAKGGVDVLTGAIDNLAEASNRLNGPTSSWTDQLIASGASGLAGWQVGTLAKGMIGKGVWGTVGGIALGTAAALGTYAIAGNSKPSAMTQLEEKIKKQEDELAGKGIGFNMDTGFSLDYSKRADYVTSAFVGKSLDPARIKELKESIANDKSELDTYKYLENIKLGSNLRMGMESKKAILESMSGGSGFPAGTPDQIASMMFSIAQDEKKLSEMGFTDAKQSEATQLTTSGYPSFQSPNIVSAKNLSSSQLERLPGMYANKVKMLDEVLPGYSSQPGEDIILLKKDNSLQKLTNQHMEALTLVMQELTDATNGQLKGFHNLPPGFATPTAYGFYEKYPNAALGPNNYSPEQRMFADAFSIDQQIIKDSLAPPIQRTFTDAYLADQQSMTNQRMFADAINNQGILADAYSVDEQIMKTSLVPTIDNSELSVELQRQTVILSDIRIALANKGDGGINAVRRNSYISNTLGSSIIDTGVINSTGGW